MLLDAAGEPAAIADAVPRIRHYAVSLEALVSELLDLSRLTCGKVDLNLETVAVEPLLQEVARGARTVLAAKPVVVETSCRVDAITSDRMRVQQILNNLATNAAKFTDTGIIALAAYLDQDTVVFEVRDSGCGIAPAQHEAIFDAFEQVNTGAERKGGGIGLGLAIVRQLTDVLGGTVSVTSRLGEGATFTVRLPIIVPAPRIRDDEPPAASLRRAS
jgi:signal transduction histidine kinase